MSKELEAFQRLLNTPDYECETLEEGMNKDDVEIVKKSLTPPTADEVCKQLSEEHGEKIFYTNDGYKNGFHTENQFVVMFHNNQIKLVNEKYFNHQYKPKTYTILGRFYEGLEKENKK